MSESAAPGLQENVESASEDAMDTTTTDFTAQTEDRKILNTTQYHSLARPPQFISVGKRGKNFYGPRDIRNVQSLGYVETLNKLSLIIPEFHSEFPKRKVEIGRDGQPKIDRKTGKQITVPDFNSIETLIRSNSLVDLDMPIEPVVEGKEQLLPNVPAKQYKDTNALKTVWSDWLKKNDHLTVGEIRAQVKQFDAVCRDAEQLAACLAEKGLYFLFFFSGCKGFRILWYDPELFFCVYQKEDYARSFHQQIAPKYFTALGMDMSFVLRLDVSVYDKCKGVKPDTQKHPDSGMYCWLVEDFSKLNEYKLVRLTLDDNLVEKIKKYWTGLADQCPLKVPYLRGSNHPRGDTYYTSSFARAEIELFEQCKRKRKERDISSNSNNTDTSVQSSSTDYSLSEMVTGDVETQAPGLLTDEIKSGIVKFLKQQLVNRKKKYPSAASVFIPMNPFPSHHVKKMGEVLILTINDWHWCAISDKDNENGRGRDHAAEKQGKVYFVVTATNVKQKCHSASCKQAYYPVYTIEAEKARLSESNTIAKRVCAERRKQEQIEYERECQRRYEARSPSPDSRMSVDTKWLPSYTEIERENSSSMKNTLKLESMVEPCLVSDPIAWHKYRAFTSRMACKEYYLKAFMITTKTEGTPIYPLIVQLEDGFPLDANYILVAKKKLEPFFQDSKYSQHYLFVVVYDEKQKRCAEWGLLKRDKLLLKEGDKNQYIILQKKCAPAITATKSWGLYLTTRCVPRLNTLNGKRGGYIEYLDEKSKEQWTAEGFGVPDDPNASISCTPDQHATVIGKRVFDNTYVTPQYLTDSIQSKLHDEYESLVQQVEVCSEQQPLEEMKL